MRLLKKFLRYCFFIIRKLRTMFYTSMTKMRVAEVKGQIKVNFKSRFNSSTYLGNNVNFNGMSINGSGKVVIGDNFHSGRECLMITQIHNYDTGNAIPYDDSYILKDIIIKDNVWLGDRVIILGGVTIEEGAIIQAGSVVVKDVPKCAIAGGHPAEVFKYRDVEHYEKLKSEGKFN